MIGDALNMAVRQRWLEPGDLTVRRVARVCSNSLLGLGALSAGVVVVVALLGGARPVWWRSAPAEQDRRSLAGAVDNGAWTVVTELRPMVAGERKNLSEPWSVSLSAESATAWLNEKLPRWLATQEHPARLPDGAELQAAFEHGVVHVGVRVPDGGAADGSGRYVSLALRPRIDGDGLWLPAGSVSVGRLDVPAAALLGGAHGGGGTDGAVRFSAEMAALLQGRVPALRGAAIRLPDGRTVRLLNFEPYDDRLVLTLQTESAR